MKKSTFLIKKMDCPSEEQLIKMKLDGFPSIRGLDFNLAKRQLTISYTGNITDIEKSISSLNLDSQLLSTHEAVETTNTRSSEEDERKLLIIILGINAGMFLIELVVGFLAQSLGVIGDSFDMLADAIVYGLSLYAVGSHAITKKNIARYSAYFQLILALFGFVEVTRRFLGAGEVPNFQLMIGVSLIALVGNSISLILLSRSKSEDAHMKASQLCTNNDVLANIGVIVAGVLVYFTNSKIPDLVIGALLFAIVARGAYQIYKLSK